MENDVVRRLFWAGMLAGTGALASIVANRVASGASGSGLQGGPARVSAEPAAAAARRAAAEDDRSVGELVIDVSERVSILVREEIELAKAEVTEKVHEAAPGLGGRDRRRGLRPHGARDAHARHRLAAQRPLLRRATLARLPIEALFWFVVAAAAGFFAYRSVQAGAPPTPELAIEEARRTETLRRAIERRRETAVSEHAPDVYVERRRRARRPGAPPGAPGRSSAQIRADIERQRSELGRSVEALRGRVAELTDWRRQIREHRRELASAPPSSASRSAA